MQKFLPRILFGLSFLVGMFFQPSPVLASHTTLAFPTISIPPMPTIDMSRFNIAPQPTSAPAVIISPSKTPVNTFFPTPTAIRYGTPTPVKTTTQPTAMPTTRPVTTAVPTQSSSPVSTDEKKTFIMNAINDYRRSNGLYAVKTSSETCSFAAIRAKEITTAFNHDGFRNRINTGTLPYKSWTSVTENIAMTSNYKNVVNMWINSAGHAANMRKDTPYVCVESSGNYYAYEGMKP